MGAAVSASVSDSFTIGPMDGKDIVKTMGWYDPFRKQVQATMGSAWLMEGEGGLDKMWMIQVEPDEDNFATVNEWPALIDDLLTAYAEQKAPFYDTKNKQVRIPRDKIDFEIVKVGDLPAFFAEHDAPKVAMICASCAEKDFEAAESAILQHNGSKKGMSVQAVWATAGDMYVKKNEHRRTKENLSVQAKNKAFPGHMLGDGVVIKIKLGDEFVNINAEGYNEPSAVMGQTWKGDGKGNLWMKGGFGGAETHGWEGWRLNHTAAGRLQMGGGKLLRSDGYSFWLLDPDCGVMWAKRERSPIHGSFGENYVLDENHMVADGYDNAASAAWLQVQDKSDL